MVTFLRKRFQEKLLKRGLRRMPARDASQLPVEQGDGTSVFHISSVKSQGQPMAAMENKWFNNGTIHSLLFHPSPTPPPNLG